MSREWKPGDVAATEYNGVASLAMVVEGRLCPDGHDRGPHWHGMGGGWNRLGDTEVTFRPLVVIDPEDTEQVEALTRAHCAFWEHAVDDFVPEEAVAMQEALRSLVAAPKPDEPTGLGAVVEADDGYLYVRHYAHDDGDDYEHVWQVVDRCANKPRVCWKWSEIAAVRVLSMGVTA